MPDDEAASRVHDEGVGVEVLAYTQRQLECGHTEVTMAVQLSAGKHGSFALLSLVGENRRMLWLNAKSL